MKIIYKGMLTIVKKFKRKFYIIKILVLFVILLFTTGCSESLKYDTWKDTHDYWGDGEYQVLKSSFVEDEVWKTQYALWNAKYKSNILRNIQFYYDDVNIITFNGYAPIYENVEIQVKLDLNTYKFTVIYNKDNLSDELILKMKGVFLNHDIRERVDDIIEVAELE